MKPDFFKSVLIIGVSAGAILNLAFFSIGKNGLDSVQPPLLSQADTPSPEFRSVNIEYLQDLFRNSSGVGGKKENSEDLEGKTALSEEQNKNEFWSVVGIISQSDAIKAYIRLENSEIMEVVEGDIFAVDYEVMSIEREYLVYKKISGEKGVIRLYSSGEDIENE
ncbi:MAG: hypothetical protein CMQ40_12450 [Gammaproteobacteria bacterium]|nr:hypothetical protein [Gammaproteobacteria bacterium]